ncbi:MAG: hypothetical protein A3I01_04295 [Betaproteobacteria bacterium RIFCSPLOWO2_02_FULL_65_24]|nr:MAG: hypothetical protein A3I01_04295 [Betaproteobacteria bacterium RIFCSPLOWO2_02_FULL_65_24]
MLIIRKLVLYLLLACLPLQSVAGPTYMLFCDDATPAAADGLHGHDDGDEHPAQDAPAGPGGISSHDCCQHYFSGVVHGTLPDVSPTRLVYVAVGLASFYSFFPEHLKRPPLTVLAV